MPDDVLEQLARLGTDLGAALKPEGLDELLGAVTELGRRTFSAAACSVARLDEEKDELVFIAAAGEGADKVIGLRMASGEGIAGWAVGSGQPIAIEEVGTDPHFQQEVAGRTGYIPRSIIALPLSNRQRTLGVMEVLDPTAATQERMEALELFGRLVARAIEISELFSHLGRSLFQAAGAAAGAGELAEALERAAEAGGSGSRDLDELAGLLQDLAEAGEEERRLAVRILAETLRYARRRRRGR